MKEKFLKLLVLFIAQSLIILRNQVYWLLVLTLTIFYGFLQYLSKILTTSVTVSGLLLSFESPVASFSAPTANLLLYGWILSTTGNFTHSVKGKSSILSHSMCYMYGLWPLMTALSTFPSPEATLLLGRIVTPGKVPFSEDAQRICFVFSANQICQISSDHAQSDGESMICRLPVLDPPRGCDSWCWPKGAQPLGTRMSWPSFNSIASITYMYMHI